MNFFEDKKKQRFKFSGIFDELIIVKGKNTNRDKYRVTFKIFGLGFTSSFGGQRVSKCDITYCF